MSANFSEREQFLLFLERYSLRIICLRGLREENNNTKAANMNLILTGRNASKKIVDLADIATEMKEIKYRFTPAKQGIEY